MLKKINSSLTAKTVFTIIFALVIGAASFTVLTSVGRYLLEKGYQSDKYEEHISELEQNFVSTVNPNGKSCDDKEIGLEWLKRNPDVSLFAYNFETGQLYFESDGSFSTTYSTENAQFYISEKANYVTVIYKDVPYKVIMRNNAYATFYTVIDFAALIISTVVVLLILFVAFKNDYIKRILKLSRQTKTAANDSIDTAIEPEGIDEIGELGRDIEAMRQAIITHYENEQDAITANNELLTSISHDIRTPLTSIIGYAEMMSDENETDIDEIKKYAEICRNKAYQLKNLTDTMFRYFYVYGTSKTDLKIKECNAEMLFVQMLGEYIVDLMQEGYEFESLETVDADINILIDIDMFRRIIDNTFSNLRRYADKSKPVKGKGYAENGFAVLEFENAVLKDAEHAESTKIGLKTCTKIMAEMGGKFETEAGRNVFRTKIYIPIA